MPLQGKSHLTMNPGLKPWAIIQGRSAAAFFASPDSAFNRAVRSRPEHLYRPRIRRCHFMSAVSNVAGSRAIRSSTCLEATMPGSRSSSAAT